MVAPSTGEPYGDLLLVERLRVSFERTLRLPDDGKTYPLPPSLGGFPVRRVADYADRVPEHWLVERGADDVFLPMHEREALFLMFSGATWKPAAVKVGVGGINAVSGAPWDATLRGGDATGAGQDYIVCPPQPWLDGINAGDSYIRQFIAMPLGKGYTVEGQITGEERIGGIQLLVFDPRPGRFSDTPPQEPDRTQDIESLEGIGLESVGQALPSPMGLGAGGRMTQKIYPDPYGVDTWESTPAASLRIHLIAAADFQVLTSEDPPPSPVSATLYTFYGLPWFALDDQEQADVAAPSQLADVKSVQQIQQERSESGEGEVEEEAEDGPINVPDAHIVTLRPPTRSPGQANKEPTNEDLGPDQ